MTTYSTTTILAVAVPLGVCCVLLLGMLLIVLLWKRPYNAQSFKYSSETSMPPIRGQSNIHPVTHELRTGATATEFTAPTSRISARPNNVINSAIDNREITVSDDLGRRYSTNSSGRTRSQRNQNSDAAFHKLQRTNNSPADDEDRDRHNALNGSTGKMYEMATSVLPLSLNSARVKLSAYSGNDTKTGLQNDRWKRDESEPNANRSQITPPKKGFNEHVVSGHSHSQPEDFSIESNDAIETGTAKENEELAFGVRTRRVSRPKTPKSRQSYMSITPPARSALRPRTDQSSPHSLFKASLEYGGAYDTKLPDLDSGNWISDLQTPANIYSQRFPHKNKKLLVSGACTTDVAPSIGHGSPASTPMLTPLESFGNCDVDNSGAIRSNRQNTEEIAPAILPLNRLDSSRRSDIFGARSPQKLLDLAPQITPVSGAHDNLAGKIQPDLELVGTRSSGPSNSKSARSTKDTDKDIGGVRPEGNSVDPILAAFQELDLHQSSERVGRTRVENAALVTPSESGSVVCPTTLESEAILQSKERTKQTTDEGDTKKKLEASTAPETYLRSAQDLASDVSALNSALNSRSVTPSDKLAFVNEKPGVRGIIPSKWRQPEPSRSLERAEQEACKGKEFNASNTERIVTWAQSLNKLEEIGNNELVVDGKRAILESPLRYSESTSSASRSSSLPRKSQLYGPMDPSSTGPLTPILRSGDKSKDRKNRGAGIPGTISRIAELRYPTLAKSPGYEPGQSGASRQSLGSILAGKGTRKHSERIFLKGTTTSAAGATGKPPANIHSKVFKKTRITKPLPSTPFSKEEGVVANFKGAIFTASVAYAAQLSDELDLIPGDQIKVFELFDDGWCLAHIMTSSRTSKGRNMRGVCPYCCLKQKPEPW